MPTFRQRDETPVVVFDAALEISPFTLFRRLSDGIETTLIDVRPERGGRELAGALSIDDLPDDRQQPIVLFDDDGSRALEHARKLQEAGYPFAKALFGGLDLYEFSLDPEVVGAETFLVRNPD